MFNSKGNKKEKAGYLTPAFSFYLFN